MSLFRSLLESLKQDVYYLSKTPVVDDILCPQIPEDFFTRNGLADTKTPRVVFSDNIGALIATTPDVKEGMQLIVYSPASDYIGVDATVAMTPTATIREEVWATEKTQVIEIGRIEIGKQAETKKLLAGEEVYEFPIYDWNWVVNNSLKKS